MNRFLYPLSGLCVLLALASPARADWVTGHLPAGNEPQAIAINPVTNKIYVSNRQSGDVTVIDGATGDTAMVAAGTQPNQLAVNPVTNRVYVMNGGGNVTVIDGATNTTATLGAGIAPTAVAVNPATNKVYVANSGYSDGTGGSVTEFDGHTHAVVTFGAGSKPRAVAVNPATNKIYVANYGGGNVTVIDGFTGDTVMVPAGTECRSLAVNPVTNRIYVANYLGASITVIDGTADTVLATVPAPGSYPTGVAVDPVADKIYVSCIGTSSVTVIDGATNGSTIVAAGSYPYGVSVNPITGKAYVVNGNATVTVINGADNSTVTLAAVGDTRAVAVNPVTNKIYVANKVAAGRVTVIDGSSNTTATVAAGISPICVAFNPVTNKIYCTNDLSSNVTVIDGATNTTTTVNAGTWPDGIVVNPVSNKIYVSSWISNYVTVIDGKTNATTNVATKMQPYKMDVNQITNKIYVSNHGSDSVTVIDGETNSTITLPVGDAPSGLAVNPITNKIYVANYYGNSVTIIDGNSNRSITVAVGSNPSSVKINPLTNKIYVGNKGSANVSIIDGITDSVATVAAGSQPYDLVVNCITNKIYVANYGSSNVTVIDGATNITSTATTGSGPWAIALNPVTNKIYVPNYWGNSVTIIDGATNSTYTVAVGTKPNAVAVNPVTNKAYVANSSSNNVTVIDETQASDTYVRAVVDSLPGNVSYQNQPVLTGRGVNRWSPNRTDMMGVIDDWMAGQNVWNWAAGPFDSTSSDSIGWTYNWGGDSLLFGENFLNIVPLETQAATSNNLGLGTPFAGNMLTYPVYYLDSIPPTQVSLLWPADNLLLADSSVSLGWTRASDNYGVGRYQVQCSADSGCSLILADTLVSDTTIDVVLSATDTINYWRVRAVDSCGNIGPYSETWSFEIDVTSPAVPTLLTPADNGWLASDTAFCSWSAVAKKTKASPVYYVCKAFQMPDTTNPVIVDTTELTSDTLLISENRYRWLVEAYDEAGNPPGISGFFNFGYDTTSPAMVLLISPNDSLITNQSNNNFIWNSCFDSISGLKNYTLQHAYDAGFTEGLAETTLTDTSITLALADSNYYWRVVARDTVGNTSISGLRYLTVDTHDPNVPTLLSPIDDCWTIDTTIVCSWNEVAKKASPAAKASKVSYVIQLDTNNTFAAPIIEDTTNILLDSFNLSEGQYYWRVMAYDLAGNFGTYSAYRTFGIDHTAPDIQYVTVLTDDPSAPYGPYEVASKVYDLSGVKTAYMFTRINGGGWDSTAMFSVSDSLRDSIPEINPATDETLSVSYYLKISDMLDHQSTSSTYSFKAIGPSGVAGKPGTSLPTVYALQNAYPNPSRGQTIFKYQLPKESKVSLTVYNVVGQAIKRFDQGTKPAGYHQISWNDNTLPNGIYFYRLQARLCQGSGGQAGEFSSTKKLLIVR